MEGSKVYSTTDLKLLNEFINIHVLICNMASVQCINGVYQLKREMGITLKLGIFSGGGPLVELFFFSVLTTKLPHKQNIFAKKKTKYFPNSHMMHSIN